MRPAGGTFFDSAGDSPERQTRVRFGHEGRVPRGPQGASVARHGGPAVSPGVYRAGPAFARHLRLRAELSLSRSTERAAPDPVVGLQHVGTGRTRLADAPCQFRVQVDQTGRRPGRGANGARGWLVF